MMLSETQIQADVETLRQQVTDTQDLYREVAALLFFRYGITPTANKLYQYVRKGSMSAPAEALAKFWDDLREKSRVRIEHPDLPDELKAAAGELVARLWTRAQSAAQEGFGAFRVEAQDAIDEAQTARETAEQERDEVIQMLAESRGAVARASERALILERDLAAERATKEALGNELAAAQRQRESLDMALVAARRDFAGELEKLREALQRSEERLEAAEKRALLEIDRERGTASKAQKELAQARESQASVSQLHREELVRLQSHLGEARQKLGIAEGSIQELRRVADRQALEIEAMRSAGLERETQNALMHNELAQSRARVAALEDEVREATKLATSRRRKKTTAGDS